MNGMTPASALKSERVLCKPDIDGSIFRWVCEGLKDNPEEYGSNITLGIFLHNRIIAGVVFNSIRQNRDVWLSIYSENKRWCNRRVLRLIFDFVFDKINAERASLLVSKDNEPSLRLVEKLGFVREGLLRHYRNNGKDCYIYGMLKTECKWRGNNEFIFTRDKGEKTESVSDT